MKRVCEELRGVLEVLAEYARRERGRDRYVVRLRGMTAAIMVRTFGERVYRIYHVLCGRAIEYEDLWSIDEERRCVEIGNFLRFLWLLMWRNGRFCILHWDRRYIPELCLALSVKELTKELLDAYRACKKTDREAIALAHEVLSRGGE